MRRSRSSLVLEIRAERDEDERVGTGRRRPLAGPDRVVQAWPDVLDSGRQRPDEVERAARHDEHAGDAAALVEDVLEWFQALLGARRVERGQGLVPARHHDRRQLLVALAFGLVRRRHQPSAERGDTGRGDDVDGRVQDDAGHLRCLSRDLRPEKQELGQHRRGRPARELLADVRGERRRRAHRQPIAHPREALRRLETGPVFDEVPAQ